MTEILGFTIRPVVVKNLKVMKSAQELFNELEYEFAHDAVFVSFVTTPDTAQQVVALLDADYQERFDESEEDDRDIVYRYPHKIEPVDKRQVKMTVGWFENRKADDK